MSVYFSKIDITRREGGNTTLTIEKLDEILDENLTIQINNLIERTKK